MIQNLRKEEEISQPSGIDDNMSFSLHNEKLGFSTRYSDDDKNLFTFYRIIVALLWVFFSSRFFVEIGVYPPAPYFSVFYGITATAILAYTSTLISGKQLSRLDIFLGVGTVIAGVAWVIGLIYTSPGYGTDEAAFVQGAAQVLFGGHNPYTANLGKYLTEFDVSPFAHTYTLNGATITRLGYPSLSFLTEYILLLFGISRQDPILVTTVSLVVASLFAFFSLPKNYRPLLLILIGTSAYFSNAAAGLIYDEMLMFLTPSFYFWEYFHQRESSFKKYISPVFFGLACAVVQDAWFFVPFLIIAVYKEASYRNKKPIKQIFLYFAVSLIPFLIVNSPFIIWNPVAWIKGSIGPLLQPLVPLGQGAIGMTIYMGLGGGNLKYYTYAAIFVGLLIACALIINYSKYKLLIPIVPGVMLFLSTRSLNEYILADIFVMLVCFGSWKKINITNTTAENPVKPAHTNKKITKYFLNYKKPLRLLMLFFGCATVLLIGLAVTTPSPLQISVVAEHTTGEEQTVDSMVLKVTNHASVAAKPDYVIGIGPYVPTPWIPIGKNQSIPPGKTRYIRIVASNIDVMPSTTNQFHIFAFLENPYSVSYLVVHPLTSLHTLLTPLDIRKILKPGQSFTVHVQLLNQIGTPVAQSRVLVALAQIIYSPQGIEYAGESIDNAPPGATPITSYTNKNGIATFHVKEIQPANQEVNFQAWLAGTAPTAYSNQLSVWFGPISAK